MKEEITHNKMKPFGIHYTHGSFTAYSRTWSGMTSKLFLAKVSIISSILLLLYHISHDPVITIVVNVGSL